MPPGPTSVRPASNCGLTSATTVPPGASSAGTTGRICASEMNETSIVTSANARRPSGRCLRLQVARVDAFEAHDARIAAEAPVQLVVPDVERDDPRRAALKEHVGESAGGRADVERGEARDVEAKDLERVRELECRRGRPTGGRAAAA